MSIQSALFLILTAGLTAASMHGPGKPAAPGVLHLHNNTWNVVNVEVRVGKFQNCDQNSSQGQRRMPKGDVWTITSSDEVCWRREADPTHPDGRWTVWTHRSMFDDKTVDDEVR
jgi:hypothetical protein